MIGWKHVSHGEISGATNRFDGFRGLLWRAPNGAVHLLSRNLKDLSSSFP